MTNAEAIEILKIERNHMIPTLFTERIEAMDIAISALQAQEAKTQLSAEGTTSDLIGRQVAIDAIYKCTDIYINNLPIMIDKAEAYKAISELPPAEPEIVRCKDCKHRGEKPISDGRYWCDIHDTFMYYCSDAERRIDGGGRD